MATITGIRAELERHLEEQRGRCDSARRRERRTAATALVAFVAGIVAVLLSLDGLLGLHWAWTLPAAVAVLVLLVGLREAATRRRRREDFAREWIERSLARLDDEWAHGQDDGAGYADTDHPYAQDLDVFGPGSLFERLDACHTVLGRDRLAAMLAGDVPGPDMEARQDAVQELLADRELRRELEVELRALAELVPSAGEDRTRMDADTRGLLSWGASETPPPDAKAAVGVQVLLGLLATAAFVVVPVAGLEWGLLIPFYLANFVVLGRAKDLEPLLERFEKLQATLGAWSSVMAVVERTSPRCDLLREARRRLDEGEGQASDAIGRLQRLAERLGWRRNTFWKLTLDVIWLWDLHVRRALLAWKRRHGDHLARWLEGAALHETFAALASYAEAVPEQAWPAPAGDGPPFHAEELAHPLLARDARVGNDLSFERPGSVLLVTGSNMSGKSTFLRAAGLAVVLGRMGLPVPAKTLRLADMQVVTSMRVQDSLVRGSSRFHAEVLRLRSCVDRAASGRLTLVLLDEILAGTNSRERHVGTRAVLTSLAGLPTLTMIATHDLGLQELEQRVGEACRMVHFRDLVEEGRMHFDYVLRPGPLPSTNALRVMRAAGLPVDPAASEP